MNIDINIEKIKSFKFSTGIEITIKRIRNGYSLFRKTDNKPIARLRITDRANIFEVMWWSHRDKWEVIGDLGGLFFSLDEALEYIDKDPIDCFWWSFYDL